MRLACCMAAMAIAAGVLAGPAAGQVSGEKVVEKWVQVTGRAAGADENARQEATGQALRVAVEKACGVFLTAQSKTVNYKAVYDKVIANATGYVREQKVLSVKVEGGVTIVELRVLVSTRKFEEDWTSIAHTLDQENNPRLIVAINEAVHQTTSGASYEVKENGIVQSTIEEYLLSKHITLMDRATAASVTKRDVLLAAIKDDPSEVASLGARFDADVVVTGQANVKFGKELEVADQTMYQYVATLNIRMIQTDSARILATKSFPPVTYTTLQRGGGEDKALAKLAKESAPALLAAVIQAWRDRANISRTIQLSIANMDYETWKVFKEEASKIPGVQAIRLREITEALANIDVEYQFSHEVLAERLLELPTVKLTIQEITANRLKLKVQKPEALPTDEPPGV